MRSRLGTTFFAAMVLTALLAGPAEAPAAPAGLYSAAATTSGLDLRRGAGSRLLLAGGHWATGLALAFRR